MKIEKARVSVQKDTFSMEIGLSKVDKENRIVSGFATLDNLDLQGDVVDFDASVAAFERSRKNVREMHQPIAVGKIVSWEPKEFLSPEGELYKGIYASVYVSRGAQDTWEKVLDGTLGAFSISGPVNKSVVEMRKGSDKPARRITDYDLLELSLVDSGGNQHCNVISIQKSADGVTEEVSGIATDVSVDEVFWCSEDHYSTLSKKEHETCLDGHDMVSIGWIESNDPDRFEKMAKMVNDQNALMNKNSEGGVVNNMSDTVEKSVEQVTPETAATETPAEETTTEEAVATTEEAPVTEVTEEEVSEAPDESGEWEGIKKALTALDEKVDSGLEAQRTTLAEAIERIEKSVEESKNESLTKLNELDTRYNEVKSSLEDIDGRFEAVTKSLDSARDSGTAIRKSNDLGGSAGVQEEKPGVWNNSIL